MAIAGIDLGTTNSLISVWTDEGPKLIKNSIGQFLTPSVVGLDDDGSVLVGAAAVERLITHPDLTISNFKRWMGTERETKLGKKSYRPEELSALVLRALKEDAETHLGEAIEEVIISVPAYFNDLQRKATLDAGKLAGLKVERLINEPTAAALAYGLNEVEEAQFLIFDLGGGTFDVSILDKYENIMEVRATAGDNFLGGNDFRDALGDYLCHKHKIQVSSLNARDKNTLFRAIENLKIKLSENHESQYSIALSKDTLSGEITRAEYEQSVEALLRRLRLPVERAISDCLITPTDIQNVVLVGGATRTPAVRKLVARLFSKLPLSHLDPDHLVALGAAVQVGLKTRSAALADTVMTDVCPYTLGIAVVDSMGGDRMMSPLIERNAVVPVSCSEIYSTVQDNQTVINIQVYQGENLRPKNNILLGEIEIPVPRAKAGQEPVEVRFTYDINGSLEVEVKVLSTQKEARKIFKNQANLSDDDLEKRFRELQAIKLHPRERAENRVLLARAERIYAESLGEKRQYILHLMQQFEIAIADTKNRNIDEVRKAFSDQLDQMERSVFEQDH